jgi:hypothetical protein
VRFVILFAASFLLIGCKPFKAIKVDPCGVLPDGKTLYCVPVNQPDKPEYERPIMPGDVCVTPDEYARVLKYHREILRRCGEKCL